MRNRRTALCIRHLLYEDAGTLALSLESSGWEVTYIEAVTLNLDAEASLRTSPPDLLIVLGGPVSANDGQDFPFLSVEIEILRERIRLDLPTLGICLGAQLMAKAMGARVYRGTDKEIGWGPLSLTNSNDQNPLSALAGVSVFHWHGDTFQLPSGAKHLASTELYENQAFMLGNHCVGLQFHPEVTPIGLESWYVAAADDLRGKDGLGIVRLRNQSATFGPLLVERASKFWGDLTRFLVV
jgi:GMP synthase (glutamine-hydrolysing)